MRDKTCVDGWDMAVTQWVSNPHVGPVQPHQIIDDLRKSRGLHSVRAFEHEPVYNRSMPAGVAQSRHAFWGYSEHVGKMTDTRKQKAEKASEMPIKHSLLAGKVQIG